MAKQTHANDKVAATARRFRWDWLALTMVMVVGAFFRIYDLGLSAFRADEILLVGLAQRKVPPADVFSRWFEVSGAAGQMPMPAWLMQIFLWMLDWPVTPLMVRLPHALLGVLTIPVGFMGGKRFGGTAFGLVFAALLAVNSFHIAVSREAYFYAAAQLGYFICFWAFWTVYDQVTAVRKISGPQLTLLGVGLFFSGFSQITGLILCSALALAFAMISWRRRDSEGIWLRNLIRLAVVYVVVLGPLFFVSWGLLPLLAQIVSNVEYGKKVLAVTGGSLWQGLLSCVQQFGWGTTTWGWLLLTCTAGVGAAVLTKKKDSRGLWILVVSVLMVVTFAAARSAAGALYEARYMSWLLPFFLCVAATGLSAPLVHEIASLRYRRSFRAIGGAVLVAVLGWSCCPAWLQTQLTGKPTPYWEIVRWADSTLPKGTLVLVDRWFEPWNELVFHPSTNVFFTFTVPNEPLDTFLQNRWRDTAKAFFEKYPDAAYLEIAKTYFDAPGVGSWQWPRTYFARHHAITNEAGLKLRKLGLANRGDFFAPNTNRVVVEFFYNTREDILAKWCQEGRLAGLLYGNGWGYVKPWQQTGDFRDWRVLDQRATLEVYNLSDHPITRRLRVRGAAIGGTKRVVTSNGLTHDFANGKLDAWLIDNLTIVPGRTEIVLSDAMGPAARVPLWVDMAVLEVLPDEGETDKASATSKPSR